MRYRNHHAGCCGFSPTHPDGGEWSQVLTLPDGSTVHADTAAELLDEILPGYAERSGEAQAAARQDLAVRLAAMAQETRITAAVAQGTLDLASPDGAALAGVLRAGKDQSMQLEREDAPGEPADWLPEPALVLVATQYAPHTEHPRISGNVVVLDPSDELALLTSLHDAGVMSYWRADPSLHG